MLNSDGRGAQAGAEYSVIAGCAIYCIVQAMWTSLAILVGMGLAAILAIFLLVWAVVKFETLGNHIKEFIYL